MPNLRAPGINTTDLGVDKWFNLYQEKLRLEFRAEAYNVFNTPQFFAPDQNLGDPIFGMVTAAFPGRSIQFALKLYW